MSLIPILWISAPKTIAPNTIIDNKIPSLALYSNYKASKEEVYTVTAKKIKVSPKRKKRVLEDIPERTSSNTEIGYRWFVNKRGCKDIDPGIQNALDSYKGPQMLITSGRRHWPAGSNHNHGRAIDIDYNRTVTAYLLSEEGLIWLADNGLQFFIESAKTKYKSELNETELKRWRLIPWAMGDLHCHIELK